MDWLSIALVALALLVAATFLLRRRRRRATPAEGPATAPGEEAKRLHQQTALSELRDMREALGPAAHNRVERRRSPPPGTAPKIERRKKGARRWSSGRPVSSGPPWGPNRPVGRRLIRRFGGTSRRKNRRHILVPSR